MTSHLLNAVKLSEGFRERVYKDTLGIDTIGYGFAIKDLVLDEDLAEIILRRKLDKLIDNADKKFKFLKDMPTEVQDVIYEMCYQLGITGVSKFKKTLAYLENYEFKMASVEMLDSRWATQTPNRAKKLSDIVRKASIKKGR
jgi:lysozyme